jgi:hypothetical protein
MVVAIFCEPSEQWHQAGGKQSAHEEFIYRIGGVVRPIKGVGKCGLSQDDAEDHYAKKSRDP